MLMYAWMKFVETAPERYDWAVKLMTLGRLDTLKDRIAAMIEPGDHVLDLGCGTGTLALRCLRRGATVTGIDMSEFMIESARDKAKKDGLGHRLTLIKDSVTQLSKHAGPSSFDHIVCTMVLGEFSPGYLTFIFKTCFELLRPGGQLIVAEEVWPKNQFALLLYRLILGLAWIPQFLLLRRVTYPVKDLASRLASAGFRITRSQAWLMTSFELVVAAKEVLAMPTLRQDVESPNRV